MIMRRAIRMAALAGATAVLVATVSGVAAQDVVIPPGPQQQRPQARPQIPLRVTIVIARYQGDKKTASLPFTLAVNTNDQRTSLRMGADVPLPTVPVGGSAPAAAVSYSYRNIGTNIDCGADTLDDGRFRLLLTVTDSQIFSDATGSPTTTVRGVPSFQSFTSTTPLILRDGQTTQYTTATDKVSGEVVKVDVTLNVVK